jgi:hypothetical protein
MKSFAGLGSFGFPTLTVFLSQVDEKLLVAFGTEQARLDHPEYVQPQPPAEM